MRCLIVDDNQLARMGMKQLVAQVQILELVAECSDAMQAYNYLNSEQIDLLFLDIEMPGMTGIELTKKLGNKKPLIIFTTAKPDYAVEAFECGGLYSKTSNHCKIFTGSGKGKRSI
jgi:DNA-binding LytR/AlgR family response regulator